MTWNKKSISLVYRPTESFAAGIIIKLFPCSWRRNGTLVTKRLTESYVNHCGSKKGERWRVLWPGESPAHKAIADHYFFSPDVIEDCTGTSVMQVWQQTRDQPWQSTAPKRFVRLMAYFLCKTTFIPALFNIQAISHYSCRLWIHLYCWSGTDMKIQTGVFVFVGIGEGIFCLKLNMSENWEVDEWDYLLVMGDGRLNQHHYCAPWLLFMLTLNW